MQCFDRPAFQDRIYQEGRMEDFDRAIEDTIIALNTGVLRTRDGSILKKADGKSSVVNIYDRDLAIWVDSTREEILKILSSICEEIGIHGLGFPRKRYEW